jgi:hypothetical protein
MESRHILLVVAFLCTIILVMPSVFSLFSGEHSFTKGTSNCLKCHLDTRQELDSSMHHTYFSCENCHLLSGDPTRSHSSEDSRCLDCHAIPLREVTDSKDQTYRSPKADVFGESITIAESHTHFVSGANSDPLMKGENEACVLCHSAYNINLSFIRPEFLEWDISNSSGTWTISNLAIGQMKMVKVENIATTNNGKLHNIRSGETNCVSCHEDIRQAVLAGGHSNEQWKKNHNYTAYTDINSYCKSCHQPSTQKNIETPYPANPFNLPIHSSMTVSCMDCHGRSGDLLVYINGGMRSPSYNSTSMGNIEDSIALQPAFIRGYLCMACKNTGNPVLNNSLHFKIYTEPEVTIYINGAQQYP